MARFQSLEAELAKDAARRAAGAGIHPSPPFPTSLGSDGYSQPTPPAQQTPPNVYSTLPQPVAPIVKVESTYAPSAIVAPPTATTFYEPVAPVSTSYAPIQNAVAFLPVAAPSRPPLPYLPPASVPNVHAPTSAPLLSSAASPHSTAVTSSSASTYARLVSSTSTSSITPATTAAPYSVRFKTCWRISSIRYLGCSGHRGS